MTVAAFEVSKIPVWNSENPERSFDIVPEQPSGRIPVTRIEHWRDFSSLLESPFDSFPRSCVGTHTELTNG